MGQLAKIEDLERETFLLVKSYLASLSDRLGHSFERAELAVEALTHRVRHQQARCDLGRPRPLHPVGGPRFDADLCAAAPDRLKAARFASAALRGCAEPGGARPCRVPMSSVDVEVDAAPISRRPFGTRSGGARGGLARAARHESAIHQGVPRLHRGARPLHRGLGGRAGGEGRRPIRHPRCGARHIRPAPARDRLAPACLRGRPAGAAGLEAPASRRARPMACPTGCAWCRSTSRRAMPGCTSWRPPASTRAEPAVVVSTGVSMYLTREAVMATLRQVAALAAGSTFVMSFLLPLEIQRHGPVKKLIVDGLHASGTPFIDTGMGVQMLEDSLRGGGGRRSMSPPPCWPNATSPVAAMASGPPTTPRNCWSRRPDPRVIGFN